MKDQISVFRLFSAWLAICVLLRLDVLWQKLNKRKGETDEPHLEFIGLRYDIIWPDSPPFQAPCIRLACPSRG